MKLKLAIITSFSLVVAGVAGFLGCIQEPYQTGPRDLTSGGSGGSGGAGGSGAVDAVATSSTATGENDPPARKYFVTMVFPLLSSGPQPCTACHTTGLQGAPLYLDNDPEVAYEKIEAFPGMITTPDNSLLLLHGKHTGPAMTAAQADATTTWLNMEAMERGLGMASSSSASSSSSGGGGKPTDLSQALTAFANCMDINDWKNNGLDQLPKVATNNNKGTCNSCHLTGNYGNYLNASDTNLTFENQKVFPYIKRWVSGTYDMNGNFVALKAVPREYLKAQEAAMCDPNTMSCHPTFSMPSSLKTGIDTFIATTLNKMNNNLCP